MAFFRRFPVAVLLALEYLPLALVPALVRSTPALGLMVAVTAVALLSALTVEGLLSPLGMLGGRHRELPFKTVVTIAVIGVIAGWMAALLGASSYETQIGTGSRSPLAALFTPFQAWALIGSILLLYMGGRRLIARRTTLIIVGAIVGAELVRGVYLAILGPTVTFAFVVGLVALLVRLLPVRWLLVGLALIVLIWPAVYTVRNNRRVASGVAVAQLTGGRANDRLFLDRSFAQIRLFSPPADLYGAPTLVELVRFGLLPRFLDPGRASLNTSSLLSVAVGGPPTSSATTTVVGNVYVIGGWGVLVLYVAVLAFMMAVVMRWRGPWSLVMVGLLAQNFVWIGSAYPDSIASFVQSLLMLAALAFVLRRTSSTTGSALRSSAGTAPSLANG